MSESSSTISASSPTRLDPEPRGTSLREVLRENILSGLFLIVAIVGLAILFLQVQLMRDTRDAMRAHVEVLKDWNRSVAEIARWQGPTSAITTTELDGRAFGLGMMEARGPADVDALVERQRQGLLHLVSANKPEPRSSKANER